MEGATQSKPEAQANTEKEKERERIILEHMKQVEILARRIGGKIPASVEFADLVSAGILGLIDAVEKFDPSYGVRFKTFAEYRIRGAMLDSLRDLDWAPRDLRLKNRKMQAVCGSLEQSLGRTATDEEKCHALGINLDAYHKLTECIARMPMSSLESLMNTDEQRNPLSLNDMPNSSNELPSALYEKHETSGIVNEAINRLPKRERLIVFLHYYEQLTMAKIGKILGVNESRISQVHASAMRRLRSKLGLLNTAA